MSYYRRQDGRTAHRSTIHYFKLGNSFTLVILIGRGARCFATNNGEFHVLDFYPHEKEVYFAYYDILQMVPVASVSAFNSSGINVVPHFDLLYSNSMCRQSSIPTSILMELLLSGGMRKECTHRSFSFRTSAILRDIETRMKYLHHCRFVYL